MTKIVNTKGEKLAALEAITEHLISGSWQEARLPNRKEINATRVVSIQIEDASAKVRGPPVDEEEDYLSRYGPGYCRCNKCL